MQRDRDIQQNDNNVISLYDMWLVIKKKRWLIIFMTLFSFGFSLAYSFYTPDVYKVSSIFVISKSMASSVQVIKSSLEPLKNLSNKQKAKLLSLDETILEAIKDIRISQIENTEAFKIEINTVDTKAGLSMMNALLFYSNNIPFVQKKIKSKIRLLEANRNELRKTFKDPMKVLQFPDDIAVSNVLISLYVLKTTYNSISCMIDELKKGEVISMAIGESFIPDTPYKPQRAIITIIYLVAGALLGIFFSLFIEWLENTRHEHEAHHK